MASASASVSFLEMYSPSFLLSAFHSLGSHTLLSPPLMTISPLMFPTDKNEVLIPSHSPMSRCPSLLPSWAPLNMRSFPPKSQSIPIRWETPSLCFSWHCRTRWRREWTCRHWYCLSLLSDSSRPFLSMKYLSCSYWKSITWTLPQMNSRKNRIFRTLFLLQTFTHWSNTTAPSPSTTSSSYFSIIYWKMSIFHPLIVTIRYLQCISTLPISKYLIDIVYNLSIQIKLPSSFLKDFFSNCIKFVYTIENKREQVFPSFSFLFLGQLCYLNFTRDSISYSKEYLWL